MMKMKCYKVEMCSLTEEECDGNNCCICEVAVEHEYMMGEYKATKSDEESTRDEYTKFERDVNIRGIKVSSNAGNFIAKVDIAGLKALQDACIVSMQPVGYVPINFPTYAMNLRKMRNYNNLPIPDEIFVPTRPDPTHPHIAAFRWGDVVYLIAPRIEDYTI